MHYIRIAILAAVVAVTAAKSQQPLHRHVRAHDVRMARPDSVVYAPVPVETVIVYELDGHLISEAEALQGIANGTLRWGDDGILSTFTNAPIALPTTPPDEVGKPHVHPTTTTAQSVETDQPAPPIEQSPTDLSPTEPSTTEQPDTEQPDTEQPDTEQPDTEQPDTEQPTDTNVPVSTTVPDISPEDPNDLVDANGNCATCDKPFPNGVVPCSQFPYGYGAMPINNEGLGGWSGIQDPIYRGSDGFDNIRTAVTGSCSDGSCCTEGTYCSYGCPNPYLKLSFPKKQGRTGQTVGGLYCNDQGMLEMADGSIGETLCGKGSTKMTVRVQNRLKKSVSICRTDYPGTESMTFPLTVGPGETGYLANPNQSKYFFWENKPTSAHYYVNKQGVPESEACTWGQDGGGVGNWSPTIFGTSFDDTASNVGYSSLKQNELNWNDKLDYSITFEGHGVVNACRYKASTGQYGQANKWFSSFKDGCTAGISEGSTLTLALTDD